MNHGLSSHSYFCSVACLRSKTPAREAARTPLTYVGKSVVVATKTLN